MNDGAAASRSDLRQWLRRMRIHQIPAAVWGRGRAPHRRRPPTWRGGRDARGRDRDVREAAQEPALTAVEPRRQRRRRRLVREKAPRVRPPRRREGSIGGEKGHVHQSALGLGRARYRTRTTYQVSPAEHLHSDPNPSRQTAPSSNSDCSKKRFKFRCTQIPLERRK